LKTNYKKIIFIIIYLFYNQFIFADKNLSLYDEKLLEDALFEQNLTLSQNEGILLKRVNVIIRKPEKGSIGVEVFNNIILPEICISNKFIIDAQIRFKIAHYLRNQLVYGEQEKYFFPDYDKFVYENSYLICRIIYYFYHKNYYGVYTIFPMESDNLFSDENLSENLESLIEQLKNENSLFWYGRKEARE